MPSRLASQFVHGGAARRLDAAAGEADDHSVAAMNGSALMFGRKAAEDVDKAVAHSGSFLPWPLSSPLRNMRGQPLCSRETGK